jgi:protein-tyrosine phosphatase
VTEKKALSILFVCMGNICRSPTAEGVFRHRLTEIGDGFDFRVDSAGTHGFHVGAPPDPRAVSAAARRGIDISGQRARSVELADFEQFDFILAMDEENLQTLQAMQPADSRAHVGLLLSFTGEAESGEVPDPYYGGAAGFERVLDIIEEAIQGLLQELQRRS